jgi:hypothetical protein
MLAIVAALCRQNRLPVFFAILPHLQKAFGALLLIPSRAVCLVALSAK